jgi:hypothetical protein
LPELQGNIIELPEFVLRILRHRQILRGPGGILKVVCTDGFLWCLKALHPGFEKADTGFAGESCFENLLLQDRDDRAARDFLPEIAQLAEGNGSILVSSDSRGWEGKRRGNHLKHGF